jgi:hypothetical protein
MRRSVKYLAAAAVISLVGATTALAAPKTVELTVKDHKFDPAEIHVPAHQQVNIHMRNLDPTAEEFDSPDLKVEKVIAGNGEGIIRLRPLAPGRYAFTGEYHADTAKGAVIAE